MEKHSKEGAGQYPPMEYKDLSAESVLRWLERANQFVRKFLSVEDIAKWRNIKNEDPSNRF